MTEPTDPASPFEATLQAFANERRTPLLVLACVAFGESDLPRVSKVLERTQFKELDVMLINRSGSTDFALRLLRLLDKHSTRLNAFVPYMAQSAGTQVALGCHSLFMSDMAFLGPIDTQLGDWNSMMSNYEFSSALELAAGLERLEGIMASSIESAVDRLNAKTQYLVRSKNWRMSASTELLYDVAVELITNVLKPLMENTDPLQIAQFQELLDENRDYARLVVKRGHPEWTEEQVRLLVRRLVEDYPDHNFAISPDELGRLGVPVERLGGQLGSLALEITQLVALDLATGRLDTIDLVRPARD